MSQPTMPEAPYTNPAFAKCWRSGWRAGFQLGVAHQRSVEAPQQKQALEALEFAAGAIMDAIGLEDGLDGRAGEAVLHMIDRALVANGRDRIPKPQSDDDTAYFVKFLQERLAALVDQTGEKT